MKEGRSLVTGSPRQKKISTYLKRLQGPQGSKEVLEHPRQHISMKIECSKYRASLGAQGMPGKATATSRPSPGTTSGVGRVKRREEKGKKRGSSLLEKWLQGFGKGYKVSVKAEERQEKFGDTGKLGLKVGEIRKRLEEETGARSSREGLREETRIQPWAGIQGKKRK